MEILERAFKTIPGMALVFAAVGLLTLKPDSDFAAAIRTFVLVWLLYQFSRSFDPLFDAVYAPRSDGGKTHRSKLNWWNSMREPMLPWYGALERKRTAASKKLGLKTVPGVYKAAKTALQKAGTWETDAYPLINYSKAARAFVVLFFLAWMFVHAPGRASHFSQWLWIHLGNGPLIEAFRDDLGRANSNLQIFTEPAIPVVLCVVCFVAYIYLRIKHMLKLYELAASLEPQLKKSEALVASEQRD